MQDDLSALGLEYDDLLLKQNPSIDDLKRIQAIENQIARQFGYDWMRQHLDN